MSSDSPFQVAQPLTAKEMPTDDKDTNDSGEESDKEINPSNRRRDDVTPDDAEVVRRYLVTKEKPFFAAGATTKYLEILFDGSVRIRDAKKSRLDYVIKNAVETFQDNGPKSEKVAMGHDKKRRNFKFSTVVEKDSFLKKITELSKQGSGHKKYKHSTDSFQFVPDEFITFFIRDAVVRREGSFNDYAGKLLVITNFRIVVVETYGQKITRNNLQKGDKVIPALEVPHMLVSKMDIVQDIVTLRTKDFRTVVIDLSNIPQSNLRMQSIEMLRTYVSPGDIREVFAFVGWVNMARSTARTPRGSSADDKPNSKPSFTSVDLTKMFNEDQDKEALFGRLKDLRYHRKRKDQLMLAEYRRIGYDAEDELCPFRLTELNLNYKLCDTYPRFLLVPSRASDDLIKKASLHRSRNRLPVITWANHQSVTISRCSQPTSGVKGKRSAEDEKLIQLLNNLNSYSDSYVICDCRPRVNAVANKYFQGKGFEGDSYAQSHIMFFDIQNIHQMRESIQAVKKCCENQLDQNWLSSLNNTQWLQHLTKILQCARRVANMVDKDKYSVLVHCSDGWDRTAQVCALAELLLDPHYRKFKGFQVLVQKEWLWFGHKMADRNGSLQSESVIVPRSEKERSPIFIQFLDSVHQIMRQFSWAFEFEVDLLLEFAEHVNSGRFGDFFCNCDREREEMELWLRTPSFFKYLDGLWASGKYRNPDYIPSKHVLRPRYAVRDMVLWDELYCRFTTHDKDRRLMGKQSFSSIRNFGSLYAASSAVVPRTTIKAGPSTPQIERRIEKGSFDRIASNAKQRNQSAVTFNSQRSALRRKNKTKSVGSEGDTDLKQDNGDSSNGNKNALSPAGDSGISGVGDADDYSSSDNEIEEVERIHALERRVRELESVIRDYKTKGSNNSDTIISPLSGDESPCPEISAKFGNIGNIV